MAKSSPKKKKKGRIRSAVDKLLGKNDEPEEDVSEDAPTAEMEVVTDTSEATPPGLVEPVAEDAVEAQPESEPKTEARKAIADPKGAPPARVVRLRYETDTHVIYVIKTECVEEVGCKKIAILIDN